MIKGEQAKVDIRTTGPCTRTRMAMLGTSVSLAAILTVFLIVAVGNQRVIAYHTAVPDQRPSSAVNHSSASLMSSLLVATDAGYPPMEYMSGTQLIGHDIDLMDAIGAEIGVTVVYTIVPWAGIFDGLIAGEYDAIINALTVTPEREEVIDFTLPYVTLGDDEDIAIAVQEGDDVLRHQIDEALCQLRIDGTLEAIIAAIAGDKPEWQPRLPSWSCSSVPTDTKSTLIYTDTQSSSTVIQVPSNAVSETIMLIYTPVETTTAPSGFAFAGHVFDLDAYQSGSLLSNFAFSTSITITLHYTDTDVDGMDESTLVLMYWNDSTGEWEDAINSCEPPSSYDRHPDENWLSVGICHLSHFAMFGRYKIYLPLVSRNY